VPAVLNRLLAQQDAEGFEWEVIVVDNNSTDATARIVHEYQKNWSIHAPLRYCFEKEQGKSFAMAHAMEKARGAWVAFLDDDNIPALDWVAAAQQFAGEHPQAGAFGGQIHGLFEEEPPETFGLVKPLFALNDRTEPTNYTAGNNIEFAAPGAGLVIQQEAWEDSIPGNGLLQQGTVKDRRGEVGEDFELQWWLYQNGWEIWHNPSMHLHHKIPRSRFDEEYLTQFFKAIGRSRYPLRMMRYKPWQRPFIAMAYLLADGAKLLKLCVEYGVEVFRDRFVRGRALVIMHSIAAPFTSQMKH
jgi:glycosyltransferase involved in cell wall biosynthesis